MGYRFVLRKSTLAYTTAYDKMDISLQVDNVGFGNLLKSKHAALLFVNASGKIAATKKANMYTGEQNVNYTNVDISKLAAGEYRVYLRLSGEASGSAYAVRFAGVSENWHSSFKSNLIGKITVTR